MHKKIKVNNLLNFEEMTDGNFRARTPFSLYLVGSNWWNSGIGNTMSFTPIPCKDADEGKHFAQMHWNDQITKIIEASEIIIS